VSDLDRITAGRWPEILGALAGLPPHVFNGQAQGCPACTRNGIAQGKGRNVDRFRWDQSDGMGAWFCNQCGGKRGAGGGGNGPDLLMRMLGCTFPEAAAKGRAYCGLVTTAQPVTPGPSAPAPAKRSRKPSRVPTAPPAGTPPPELGGAEEQYPYGADLENPDFWIQRIPRPPKVAGGKADKLFIHRVWLDGRWHRPSKRDDFTSEWPAPRPIYRLPQLLAAPDAPVLVVEGERTANRAALLFPDHVVVAWCHGKEGKQHTDWSPLASRSCTLWPDNDRDGQAVMAWLAEHLQGLGCAVAVVTPPEGVPAKWDLGDAGGDGWTPERAAAELERLAQPVARSSAQPAPETPADPSTITGATDRLRQAITSGVSGSALQQLVAQLAADGDHSPIALQRIATELEREDQQAAAVAIQAAALATEADRRELGQLITPAYLLPAPIAAAIEARTRYLPCDGPSAVLPYLAAVAGLAKLGTQVEASAVAGYRVPVNLFTCLVGRSGAKKSPVDRLLILQPLAPLLDEQARADRREREQWREACREVKRGEPKPEQPQARRILTSDFTGEGLAEQLELLEQAGRGLLIHRDELSGMFGSLNQYRSGRGADEQQLLELYDGSGMTSLRVSGGRSYGRSQVSIAGGTQPDVLRQLVAHGDASGLWARFLFCPLPERVVRLPLHTTADEVAEVEAAARLLAECCSRVFSMPPAVYRLSPPAAELFATFEERKQGEALRATIGAQGAVHGKAAGKVLRLAGVLHLLAIAAGDLPSSAEIGADAIDRACVLVDHLDGWALGLHADVNSGELPSLLRAIHRAAEAAGAPVGWRQVYARLARSQRQGANAAAAGEAMRALAAAGYGELVPGPHDSILYRALKPLP
jgi:hypothetical protein